MLTLCQRVSGREGRHATVNEVRGVLGPDIRVTGFGRGRLKFSDGREAWKAGPDWIIGDPDDLRRLWNAVG